MLYVICKKTYNTCVELVSSVQARIRWDIKDFTSVLSEVFQLFFSFWSVPFLGLYSDICEVFQLFCPLFIVFQQFCSFWSVPFLGLHSVFFCEVFHLFCSLWSVILFFLKCALVGTVFCLLWSFSSILSSLKCFNYSVHSEVWPFWDGILSSVKFFIYSVFLKCFSYSVLSEVCPLWD